MRLYYIVLTAIIALSFSVSSDAAWKKITNEKGQFSIEMPGEHKYSTNVVPTKVGDITMEIFMYEMDGGVYFMSYSDFPEKHIEGSDKNSLLQNAKTGAVKKFNFKMVYEKKIKISGYPGIDFLAKGDIPGKGKGFMKTKIFLIKNRLFQIFYLGTGEPKKSSSQMKDINKFLDSFTVLEGA